MPSEAAVPPPPRPHYPRSKRRRRNHSEVSCCLKYVIFGFNVIFWLIGLSILAIGVWAWTEKDTFNNLSLLTNVALDPAFLFIWAGKFGLGQPLLALKLFYNFVRPFRCHYVRHRFHWMCGSTAGKHNPLGRVCHLPSHVVTAGNDCWNFGFHFQRLDQRSSQKWIPSFYCTLQR